MTTTKKTAMYERIAKHGQNLIKLFNLPADTDPVKLCKKLRTLELKAGAYTLAECNNGYTQVNNLCKVLAQVKRVLFPDQDNLDIDLYKAVFINGPRGYALKIQYKHVRENKIQIYTDMGGYGILAPDLTNN